VIPIADIKDNEHLMQHSHRNKNIVLAHAREKFPDLKFYIIESNDGVSVVFNVSDTDVDAWQQALNAALVSLLSYASWNILYLTPLT